MANGQGSLTYANGDKYVGEWVNDRWHGQGTYTFPDGENYIGEWKVSNKHGQGTHMFMETNMLGNGKMISIMG